MASVPRHIPTSDLGIAELNQHAGAIVACLGDLHALLIEARAELRRDHIDTITTIISGSPFRIVDYGRRHLLVLAAAAFTMDCDIPGYQVVGLALTIGWNVVDLPANTTVQPHLAGAANQQNILIRATDDVAPGLV